MTASSSTLSVYRSTAGRCVVLVRRLPGPAGTLEANLPGGVYVRLDGACPTQLVDVLMPLDDNGAPVPLGLATVRLLCGDPAAEVAARGGTGTTEVDWAPTYSHERTLLVACARGIAEAASRPEALLAAVVPMAERLGPDFSAVAQDLRDRAIAALGAVDPEVRDSLTPAALRDYRLLRRFVGMEPDLGMQPSDDSAPGSLDPEPAPDSRRAIPVMNIPISGHRARVGAVRGELEMPVDLSAMTSIPLALRYFGVWQTIDRSEAEVTWTATLTKRFADQLWVKVHLPAENQGEEPVSTGAYPARWEPQDDGSWKWTARGLLPATPDGNFDIFITRDLLDEDPPLRARRQVAAEVAGISVVVKIRSLHREGHLDANELNVASHQLERLSRLWEEADDRPRARMARELAAWCRQQAGGPGEGGPPSPADPTRGYAEEGIDIGLDMETPLPMVELEQALSRAAVAALAKLGAEWRADRPGPTMDLTLAEEGVELLARQGGSAPDVLEQRASALVSLAESAFDRGGRGAGSRAGRLLRSALSHTDYMSDEATERAINLRLRLEQAPGADGHAGQDEPEEGLTT